MSTGKDGLAARARCLAGAVLDMVSGEFPGDDLDRIAELKGWLDTFPATDAGRPDDPELAVVWRVRRILDAGQ